MRKPTIPIMLLLLSASPWGCKRQGPASFGKLSTEASCLRIFTRLGECARTVFKLERARARSRGSNGRPRHTKSFKAYMKRVAHEKGLCKVRAQMVKPLLTRLNSCYQKKSCSEFGHCFIKTTTERRKRRTTSATNHLRKIYQGAKAYFGTLPQKKPMGTAKKAPPKVKPGQKVWKAIRFNRSKRPYFHYKFSPAGKPKEVIKHK